LEELDALASSLHEVSPRSQSQSPPPPSEAPEPTTPSPTPPSPTLPKHELDDRAVPPPIKVVVAIADHKTDVPGEATLKEGCFYNVVAADDSGGWLKLQGGGDDERGGGWAPADLCAEVPEEENGEFQ